MKASIRDVDLLRSVSPLNVAAYLRANGWSHIVEGDDRPYAVYVYQDHDSGMSEEVILPLKSSFRDYPLRLAEVFGVLEMVEQRSQLAILRDILASQTDVLRFRLEADRTGHISLDDGVRLVQQVKDLMLAGACAAVQPRPYFHARKPNEAEEYVRNVRLGQTERGSYVVKVLSRVPPVLQESFSDIEGEDPFPRKVTKTLAQALHAAGTAAERAVVTGRFDAFREAVKQGVSANLCEALARISDPERPRDVQIGFTWSPSRPVRASWPNKIEFSPDSLAVFGEAARVFREKSPVEDFEVHGYVVDLTRVSENAPKIVTVATFVEGQPRRVRFELKDPEYGQAVIAHKEWRPIICFGELFREGRSYELRNVRGLRVENSEDE